MFTRRSRAPRAGAFVLALGLLGASAAATQNEVCDNGLDDDGDGLVDCQDPDCASFRSCGASGIHVAVWGTDSAGCGAPGSPCATISQGLEQAVAGQRVLVHAGTYEESWIWLKSHVRVVSADGEQAARIHSTTLGVMIDGVTDAEIDGFEIFGDRDQGVPEAGLVRVQHSNDVRIKNCILHDAPADCDLVKVTDADGLSIERCIVYNPAHRMSGGCPPFQEGIDLFGQPGAVPRVRNVTVRRCWLYHTDAGGDWLILAKVNTENILLEDNVFGPSAGGTPECGGNPGVGLGNSQASDGGYHVSHAIVRNNLFLGLQGDGALGVQNARDVWIYNNVFFRNSGPDLRCVLQFRGNQVPLGAVHLLDNVFVENEPQMFGATFFWNRDTAPQPFVHANNLYVGNIATSDIPYSGESGSVYDVDPLFVNPVVPSTGPPNLARLDALVRSFRILRESPAVDHGLDVVSIPGHPNWAPGLTDMREDAVGRTRPAGGAWDLGLHESVD